MAKSDFWCTSTLCIYLLLVTRVSADISNSEYYLYSFGSSHRHDHTLAAHLLDSEDETHTIHKRDTSSYEEAGGGITTELPAVNLTLTTTVAPQESDDDGQYYHSTISTKPDVEQYYWVNMTNRTDVKSSNRLTFRRATVITLSFEFPFYGHRIKNVTVASGGFLFVGDYVHSWLSATQYVAPLMAGFDTTLSNDSNIKYVDNGTAFTVQWEKVILQDQPKDGQFTFQVTLFKNGDIVFVYQNLPLLIKDISDENHPVKVGLSDAYLTEKRIFFVQRKTVYEYQRLGLKQEHIRNGTVIYLKALGTCLEYTNCESCLSENLPNFKCVWCSKAYRCSSGVDRHRQEWMDHGCDQQNYTNFSLCNPVYNLSTPVSLPTYNYGSQEEKKQPESDYNYGILEVKKEPNEPESKYNYDSQEERNETKKPESQEEKKEPNESKYPVDAANLMIKGQKDEAELR